MTTILITGANGFIGSQLAATMPVGSSLNLNGETRTVDKLVLVDHVDDLASESVVLSGPSSSSSKFSYAF